MFNPDNRRALAENNEKCERRSKYGNKKLVMDGEKYDSLLEYRRHKQLLLLEKAGAITGLERQVRFVLVEKRAGRRAVSYVADFVYFESGRRVVEDCKSKATKTQAYRIKKKLMAEVYGIEIKEIVKEEI